MAHKHKPRDQVLRPALFVNENVFFNPITKYAPAVAEILKMYRPGAKSRGRQRALSDLLEAICVLHESFGDDMPSAFRSDRSVPIPVDVVDIVIKCLTGRTAAATEARSKQAEENRRLLDEKVREGHSRSRAAELVAEKLFPSAGKKELKRHANTLRRKPQK
jgi:hypothetical protein